MAGIAFIIIRSRRRGGSFSPQGDDRKDEEEGLLYPPLELEGGDVEVIPTAKLRQGPKSKRTPSSESFDEENEGLIEKNYNCDYKMVLLVLDENNSESVTCRVELSVL